jgi:hypothetical protein
MCDDTESGDTGSEEFHTACGFNEVERCIAFVRTVE